MDTEINSPPNVFGMMKRKVTATTQREWNLPRVSNSDRSFILLALSGGDSAISNYLERNEKKGS